MEQLKHNPASLLHQEKVAEGRMRSQSPRFQRQRKFLMVLPVLVLPFITLMFWALGGGKAEDGTAQTQARKGLNMALPDAYLKESKPLDKLSYYEKAASDSAKLRELMKKDPYYNHGASLGTDDHPVTSSPERGLGYKGSGIGRINTSPYSGQAYNDPNEAKVYEKLEQLNKALDQPAAIQGQMANDHLAHSPQSNAGVSGADIDRLEEMMHVMNQPGGEDPEMQQINGMLEKILDIQHPDRVQEKLRHLSESRKGQVFAVSVNSPNDLVSLLDNDPATGYDSGVHVANKSNGFYSLNDPTALSEAPNAIEAVVHETQTLVNGSTVKLRLINDVYINGILIPKDNFLFGTALLNGERLQVGINSIRFQNSLFPVGLSVYDLDGMSGIYVPGAITRDVAKQSAGRAVQSMDLNTFGTSVGAQAASAGIEAAKNLFGKKAKLIKVTVKAGYQVLLRDEKQQQDF